ncbi:MAG: hypothetical protein H6R37_311, partial [Deltaproteobacteria bacterium]|nr:hypothetical protein [Deltaproteobacteria bacterium]
MSFKIKTAILEGDAEKYPFARRVVEQLQSSLSKEARKSRSLRESLAYDLDKET